MFVRALAIASYVGWIAGCSDPSAAPGRSGDPDGVDASWSRTCADASVPEAALAHQDEPCASSADCPSPLVCGYSILEGCGARGKCEPPLPPVCCPPGEDCGSIGPACGCDGGVATPFVSGAAGGFAAAPVSGYACAVDVGSDPCPPGCPTRGYGTCDGTAWECVCTTHDAGAPRDCFVETTDVEGGVVPTPVPVLSDAGFPILCCIGK